MKFFYIDNQKFEYKGPSSVIEGLLSLQGIIYSYDDFFQVLKRRLRLWTGNDAVAFYDEVAVVDLLIELKQIEIRRDS